MKSKVICDEIKRKIREEIKDYTVKPNLTVIRVGNDPSSITYVKNKIKACDEVGMLSTLVELPESISQEELISIIRALNKSPKVHGLLVQLPLPEHIDSNTVANAICPSKDVDCLTPYNIGLLSYNIAGIKPCTPSGILSILNHYGVNLRGSDVVIVGRSNIVGKPMATMLTNMGATVQVCHSLTKDLASKTSKADIVICAIGKPKYFKAEHFKEGAVVIDVGIDRDENGKLCGDVDYDNVISKVKAITPVPGGVGPTTVVHLLSNTLKCYMLNNIE